MKRLLIPTVILLAATVLTLIFMRSEMNFIFLALPLIVASFDFLSAYSASVISKKAGKKISLYAVFTAADLFISAIVFFADML